MRVGLAFGALAFVGALALLGAAWAPATASAEGDDSEPPAPEGDAKPGDVNPGDVKLGDVKPGDPAAAAVAFEKGEVAREEERWKDAAEAYWKAIEADSSHYLAHVRYQEAELKAGSNVADVVGDYDGFVADFPDSKAFRLHRLRLEAPASRPALLDPLLAASPKDADVLLEVGRLHLQTGERAKAVKALTESLAAAGTGRLDVLLLLAQAEFLEGKRAEARVRVDAVAAQSADAFQAQMLLARFDLLEEKWTEAARRADLVLQMRPTWIAAFLVKAEALSRGGQREQAVQALEAARAKQLETRSVRVALADLLARDGSEGGLKAAAELYAKVLETLPQDAHALFGAAWVIERQGKFDEAEKRYRAVAAVRPTDPAAVNSVGFCLLKQGRITDAQVQFKKAVDLGPLYAHAYGNLGASYDAQANYAEAIKWYEKLLKLKGQESNFRAMVNLAFDYEAVGTFPKAEEYLRKARKVRPEDALVATWLGDNLYFQEKWKDAEKAYQEAIALDDKVFYAHRGLGFTLGRLKRWSDAVSELEKAKALKGDDQDVLVALGDIYYAELGDLENALKSYEAYVQVGGTDPSIPELITEIRKELEKDKK